MLLKRQLCAIGALCVVILSTCTPCLGFILAPSLRISRGARRIGAITEECSLDETAGDCLSSAGYELQEEEFMSVSQVFVAQVESLRTSHASYEDASSAQGSNLIKYHKRNKRGKHFLSSSETADDDENSHVANMEYNRLVGEDDVVLVDVIRKPGMSSVSRAFPGMSSVVKARCLFHTCVVLYTYQLIVYISRLCCSGWSSKIPPF